MEKIASRPEVNALSHSARLAVVWNTGFTLFRDLRQFGLTLELAPDNGNYRQRNEAFKARVRENR